MGTKVGLIFGIGDRQVRRTVTHDSDASFSSTHLAADERMIQMEKARYALFSSEDQVALELGLQPKAVNDPSVAAG